MRGEAQQTEKVKCDPLQESPQPIWWGVLEVDWPFRLVPAKAKVLVLYPYINPFMVMSSLHRRNVTLDKATSFKWRAILQRGTQLWTISGQPSCQLENESSIPVGTQGDRTQHLLPPILCVLFASYKELILSGKKKKKTKKMIFLDWTDLFSLSNLRDGVNRTTTAPTTAAGAPLFPLLPLILDSSYPWLVPLLLLVIYSVG